MLKALKRVLAAAGAEGPPLPAQERHQLQVAVAVLLHEARRSDYSEAPDESDAALRALMDIFALDKEKAAALLGEGREKAQHLTSLYAPLAVIKRDFSLEERIGLVEQLWRVSFADGQLNLYEDHYVRKVAHLLYVPNTQSMLARNRARSKGE